MIKTLIARIKQKKRTIKKANLPKNYRGLPVLKKITIINNNLNNSLYNNQCPTNALFKDKNNELKIDLGRCIFCPDCACKANCNNINNEKNNIIFSQDYRMAVSKREDLIISQNKELKLASALRKDILKIFKRNLKLRQVSAGGCNACELDTNVLTTVVFDLSRFGIDFVASPRHADGLLVTGTVPKNMHLALIKTYEAIAEPKIVIAVGACAISGGIYRPKEADEKEGAKEKEIYNCGVSDILPVDLYIPGCPPHPLTILDGLLRLLNKNCPFVSL